jgi:hypothetical protein
MKRISSSKMIQLLIKQIVDTTFSGYGIGIDYNIALGTNEQDYFNFNLLHIIGVITTTT